MNRVKTVNEIDPESKAEFPNMFLVLGAPFSSKGLFNELVKLLELLC